MPSQPEPDQQQLEKIALEAPAGPDVPDANTSEALRKYEEDREATLLVGLRQDISQRKKFGTAIFILACVWLAFIGFVLSVQGFGGMRGHAFNLGQPVILALIGTTTINVLGLCYVVANYLFPKPPKPPDSK